jgi:hypothetical protein
MKSFRRFSKIRLPIHKAPEATRHHHDHAHRSFHSPHSKPDNGAVYRVSSTARSSKGAAASVELGRGRIIVYFSLVVIRSAQDWQALLQLPQSRHALPALFCPTRTVDLESGQLIHWMDRHSINRDWSVGSSCRWADAPTSRHAV